MSALSGDSEGAPGRNDDLRPIVQHLEALPMVHARLYAAHVLQAEGGCDFDFLRRG